MEHFDAIVIGSGFGGAVAACRLAQAGFSVLVLERGRRYEANDFPALPDDDRLAPELRRWVWSTDEGLWDIKDLGEIVAVQAAGYGGGSLLYANVHRAAGRGFDNELARKFHKDALEVLRLAAFMLDSARLRSGRAPFRNPELDEVIEKWAASRPAALAINYGEAPISREWQGACNGCGKCCTVARKSETRSTTTTWRSPQTAPCRTQCEVSAGATGAEPSASKQHWTVEYVKHLTASYVSSRAEVFLCAGVVNTARLLREAKLIRLQGGAAARGPWIFPNADAAAWSTTRTRSARRRAALHHDRCRALGVERGAPGACDKQPSSEASS